VEGRLEAALTEPSSTSAPALTVDVFVRPVEVEVYTLPDRSLLLFDKRSGTALPINETGARIWKMCDGANTIDQIVDSLAAHFDAERSQIDRDAREFLAVLARLGLLSPQLASS
jgi:hypothetical protein